VGLGGYEYLSHSLRSKPKSRRNDIDLQANLLVSAINQATNQSSFNKGVSSKINIQHIQKNSEILSYTERDKNKSRKIHA